MVIIGSKDFSKGDVVYHKRLKKVGLFIDYIDDNLSMIKINKIMKRVNTVLLERI